MLRILLVIVAIVGLLAVVTPSLSNIPNCGGNSAALADVKTIVQIALYEMADSPEHSFQFTEAPERSHDWLRECARKFWIRKARFLVLKSRISDQEAEYPQLIAVCDTPFRNVPQRRFWESPPTHAAAYSDGSTRLLGVDEFQTLPKGKFVALDALYPPLNDARNVGP